MGFKVNNFYNSYTLNIFCDASILKQKTNVYGCYGAVAVCCDNIIESIFRLVSNTTNNNSEIKGIRAALSLANKYKNQYKIINIFSDSQISVFGLRDYIYKWRFNDGYLVGTAGTPIANQEVFVECHYILNEIINTSTTPVILYHQAAHVGTNFGSINKAAEVFRKSNNIYGNIDLNFIRYISTYNNYVDNISRSNLRRSIKELHSNIYCDPLIFVAKNKITKGEKTNV